MRQETGAKKALPQQKQIIGFLLGVGFGQLFFAAQKRCFSFDTFSRCKCYNHIRWI